MIARWTPRVGPGSPAPLGAGPRIGLAHRPVAAHLLDEAHPDRRRERARRLERDALRGEVRPGVADAHVDDPAHVAGREEQQVVERHRRRVTDDVDPDLAVLGVRPGADRGVDRLDLGELLVEPAVGDRLDDVEVLAVRPGAVVGRLGHGPDDPDLVRSPGDRLAQVGVLPVDPVDVGLAAGLDGGEPDRQGEAGLEQVRAERRARMGLEQLVGEVEDVVRARDRAAVDPLEVDAPDRQLAHEPVEGQHGRQPPRQQVAVQRLERAEVERPGVPPVVRRSASRTGPTGAGRG